MPTAKFSGLIQQLGTSATDIAGETDGELLTRFLATRDEPAFAEIVRRYGTMVFAVCRRVTSDVHLAEDAFQAVFVVLATRAASIRPASALPAWLHSVATRTALRARTVADRRRKRETTVESLPETHSPTSTTSESADIAAIVDEEIARLPETLRAAVVLCELEGYSRKAAAEHLGVPEGTVSSRLAAARKSLADRLRNRGVMLNTATLAVLLGSRATASVPASLAARAVSSALSPELLPAAVSALSTGVLRVMLVHKLKTVGLFAVLALGVAVGAAWASSPSQQPDVPNPLPAITPNATFTFAPQPEPKVVAKPLPKGPNKLVISRGNELVMLDPDGKNEKAFQYKGIFHSSGVSLSPDGSHIAFIAADPPAPAKEPGTVLRAYPKLYLMPVADKDKVKSLDVQCEMFVWSPDGTEIACNGFDLGDNGTFNGVSHQIINVKTLQKTKVTLDSKMVITGWNADGRFLTTKFAGEPRKDAKTTLYLMNRDGTEHKKLTEESELAVLGKMSRDGTRIMYLRTIVTPQQPGQPAEKAQAPKQELVIYNLANDKFSVVEEVPLNATLTSYCWSPDGKQIAYTWQEKYVGKPEDAGTAEVESHLMVCDVTGKNAKTIHSHKTPPYRVAIGGVDWR